MAEAEVLAKLQDIQLPDPIGWWPLAPGWYLLALMVLVLAGLIVYYFRRRYLHGLAKRQALHLLDSYYLEYQREKNSQLSSMKVSELLRRVSLAYFPREEVASLQGEDWISFLNSTAKGVDFNRLRESLLELPYQPVKDYDLAPLFAATRAWIKQRGKPCSN